jgi:hypothetical protein
MRGIERILASRFGLRKVSTLARVKLGWWNGRHVRLRGVCRKACGFKSRPEHEIAQSTCPFASQLFDLASIAYRFRSLSEEITSHRGKERFACQIPKIHKEPMDSVLTTSKIRHLTLNDHALRCRLPNSCYYFSGELNAND